MAQNDRTITMAIIVALPRKDPVPRRKMSMKGYPVGDSIAASRLPMLKSTAINIPKPSVPFKNRLHSIEAGTVFEGFRISSDIWMIISESGSVTEPESPTWMAPSTPNHQSASESTQKTKGDNLPRKG